MDDPLARARASRPSPPLVLFEDEHLLVVDRPAGWRLRAPGPFGCEGVVEWLRNREPRWASVAPPERGERGASGPRLLAKTPEAAWARAAAPPTPKDVLHHPATGAPLLFASPQPLPDSPADALRAALIEPALTDCFRLRHGASDWPFRLRVDRLGPYLHGEAGTAVADGGDEERLGRLARAVGARGAYLSPRPERRDGAAGTAARHVWGEPAPERLVVTENGVRFELSFALGPAVGLFLDQRDNRRRLLVDHVAAGFPAFEGGAAGREVLNCFAFTCAFSLCAALAGARTTSLDLSGRYLERGRRNFELNGLDPSEHAFVRGDALDWLRRLARKGRRFDAVLLDPPTFSRTKRGRVFRAEKDYGALVREGLSVLASGGLLLASTNAARLRPEPFVREVEASVRAAGRAVLARHFAPQPPDFPASRAEPAHLKTVWLRVE